MLLELQEVHSFYGTSHILHGVGLSIEDRGMVSVLGRNGVGKSTLMRSVMGVLRPTRGKVIFKGQDVTNLKSHHRARLGLSYVPQGRELIPDISVEENLLVALMGKGNNGGQLSVPEYVYEYFPAIREFLKRRAGVLSGGQQ
ncbi:MAG: ATP-binding cassette domain-containing protein, partial [Lysobacterales bacterium]